MTLGSVAGDSWTVVKKAATRFRPVIRVAPLVVGGGALLAGVALTVLDLSQQGGLAWSRQHPWASQMLSSVIIVMGTYLVVDRAIERRQRLRWRETSWDSVEGFADELATFLSRAERDWLDCSDLVFPISERNLEQCLEAIDWIDDAAAALCAVAPATAELASFVDYVADVRLCTRQWQAAATQEVDPQPAGSESSRTQDPSRRFHSSRFPPVLSLLGCYKRLTSQVDRFLDGNYLEKATFGPGSLSSLEYAWHGAEENEWDKTYRNRKIVAKQTLMPAS